MPLTIYPSTLKIKDGNGTFHGADCLKGDPGPQGPHGSPIDVQVNGVSVVEDDVAHIDTSGKADKVSNATSGNFASLDANGNLIDSGKKASDFLTEHQDISGKQDALTFDVNPVSGSTNPVTSSGVYTALQGKVDKVISATAGNLAALDANGNLTDSGVGASDSEAYSIGTRGGNDVDSSDPAYHNNAKYYASQAMAGTPQGYSALVDDISDLKSTSIKKHGNLSAEEVQAGGYTDLIQLPTGFAYAIPSFLSIGGKPVGLASAPFNFISIPAGKSTVSVSYTLYLAISTDVSYYGFGLSGDTAITWQRIGNGDDNIIALKNRINTILGESIQWEKGYIAAVGTGNPIAYTALNAESYVHAVINVTAGDVVYITSTAGVSSILITMNGSGNQTRRSTQAQLSNFGYTIASGDTKVIINARADRPYDVYIKSATTSTIATLTNDVAKCIKEHGLLTSSQVTAGGYTDLIQLPLGYAYGIAGGISIGGRPSGLRWDPFTFVSIPPIGAITYTQFFAMGKNCAYYGLGYAGDTTISWRQWNAGQKPFDTVNGPKVVLLGDSITQGVGSSDYSPTGEDLNTSVYPTKRNVGVKAWGAQFVSLLNSEYNCTAVNNGVSQFNATHLNDNLNVLLPSGTDMVVLTIGTNNRYNSVADFKTAFITLVRNIKDMGAKLFVFSPIPVNGATTSMGMGNMQKVIEKECYENEVTFYPLYTMFRMYIEENNLTLGDYYADSLHPNDAGHKLIYQIVCKCLKV